MEKIVYKGRIDGDFEGFDEEALFKLMNGTYWLQTRYKYWYHYAYSPEIAIVRENGRFYLHTGGNSVEVAPVEVLESRIKGAFTGCKGDSVYELVNGQVWRQSRYKYKYKYAYRPKVAIYRAGGGYKMKAAGITIPVRRIS
jgi:hypothetical protein